jgi:hypothetical protein
MPVAQTLVRSDQAMYDSTAVMKLVEEEWQKSAVNLSMSMSVELVCSCTFGGRTPRDFLCESFSIDGGQ